MASTAHVRATFKGSNGDELAARLDLPAGDVRAYALFAHCFTCSKDLLVIRRISAGLARAGVAVLRFDFTGLGNSAGDFANTTFSSNVEDLVLAADWLRETYQAPALLIGHSLGGAAVLAAAGQIPEAKAVVTIGAPYDVGHVMEQFGASLDSIETDGEAHVSLAGRTFKIKNAFVRDARGQSMKEHIGGLRKALLVMHSPRDEVVGIENATKIFIAAKHPKSFISLDDADHFVSGKATTEYAAGVIASWASKYIPEAPTRSEFADGVRVEETGHGKFQNIVVAGQHSLIADEPKSVGGDDSGPSPYDYLSIALGACTSMTLRIYAQAKKLELGRVRVEVKHGKVPAQHCDDCGEAAEGRTGKIDRFERTISIDGGVDPALKDKLIEIAGKCPVHRTLEATSAVVTRIADQSKG